MYQKERKQQILYLLQEKNEMTVAELSRLLFTSESSIRRDLQTMELSGLVKRTHGGVKLLSDNPTIVPFASRLHYKVAEKKKMAKKALSYIQDGQVIFLDQSSSALFLAHELVNRRQVTIITNNIEILATMAKSELKVYASGGYICPTNRNCLIGEDAHEIFRKTHADLLFFRPRRSLPTVCSTTLRAKKSTSTTRCSKTPPGSIFCAIRGNLTRMQAICSVRYQNSTG